MNINARHLWPVKVLACALLVMGGASEASAQSGKGKKRESVIVLVAPDSLVPAGTMRIVLDRRKGNLNAIYLRRASATSMDLERAMRSLVISHLDRGARTGKVSVASLPTHGGESADPATRALFASVLAAPRRQVAGAGLVPAVVVTLPDDDTLKEKFKEHRTKKS